MGQIVRCIDAVCMTATGRVGLLTSVSDFCRRMVIKGLQMWYLRDGSLSQLHRCAMCQRWSVGDCCLDRRGVRRYGLSGLPTSMSLTLTWSLLYDLC